MLENYYTNGKTDGRRVNKEERRNTILDAAEQIFSSKDYHEATLDEIAQQASLSKAALYLYFDNKIDLFFSTIERKFLRLIEIDQNAIAETDDSLEAIKEIITREIIYFNDNLDFYKVLHLQKGEVRFLESEFKIRILPLFDKKLSIVSECIRRGQEDGIFQKIVDAGEVAFMLFTIIHHFASRLIFRPEKNASLLDKTDIIRKIFLEGLLVRK